MSGRKYRLAVTQAQAGYLRELVQDDLEATDLTTSERQQARSVLRKLDDLLADLAAATITVSCTCMGINGKHMATCARADQ